MTRVEFLTHMDEMLELPPGTIKGNEKLEELERWDSLAMVSFIALADEHCNLRLSPRQFPGCVQVDDLLKLAGFTG